MAKPKKASVAEISSKLASMLNEPAVAATEQKAPAKKTTKTSVFTGEMIVLGGMARLDIKCYNAAEADKVERNNLHKDCLGKVKNGGRSCSKCNGDIMSDDDVVKGVEVGKGKFVTLTDEEVAKVAPIKDNEMFVTGYIAPELVDLTYIEDSEFVCIDPDSKNPRKDIYDAFVAGMSRSNRYGKGVRVHKGREQHFIVRPYQDGLMLHHLFAEYEVRSCNKFQTPEVNEELAQTVAAFMEANTEEEFAPAKYDAYLGAVRGLIQSKANDQTPVAVTKKESPAPAVDLMASLKQSLAEQKSKSAKAGK